MAQRTVSEPGIALGAQQLAILLDSTQELIAILGPDGTVQFANGTFQSVLGYRQEDLLGRSIHAIVHALDVDDLRERLKKVARKQVNNISERCRFRCRDDSWKWIQYTFRNRMEEAGLDGILFHASDVTDLHRMESERAVNSDIVHAMNATANLDQLLARIHGSLKRILPAENCFVALHNPADDTFYFPFLVDEYDTAPPPQKV